MHLAQVLSHSQLIFPSKTWFFGISLNFQQQKSLKNQYLPHSKSKSYQINSIKSCSSRSFQQHQRHIPLKFCSYNLNFFQWKNHQYSRTLHHKSKHHETKPMHPSSSRAFQKDQERNLKRPSSVDLISTKQNKQTTFLHNRSLSFQKIKSHGLASSLRRWDTIHYVWNRKEIFGIIGPPLKSHLRVIS